MALLINKLFSNKKRIYNRHTDVGDRTFSFTKEQVRVVLFRECDFRGRKLLFDSQTVQKVPLTPRTKPTISPLTSPNQLNTKTDVFVEISNGYGYQYSKPSSDTVILGETVFGSVAMSYQGTSFKIHSFTTPRKLMCTLVFPSPKVRVRSRVSVTNISSQTSTSNSSGVVLEKSEKLYFSSTSSVTSYQEPSSGHSTDSDIKKISTAGSVPLDVPLISGDSGFYGDQSCNSMSSGTQSLMLLDGRLEHANMLSFSCGSLYKRWFRSASTSLENSSNSDISLGVGGSQNSASADDCLIRNHHRSSKLGLAIILQLTENKENEMESFFLKHAVLIEAMATRARVGTENAYNKHVSFASLMYDIHQEICQYLSDLLIGNFLNTYLWHELGSNESRTLQKSNNFLTTSLFNFNNHKTKSENNLVNLGEKSDRKRTRTDSCRSDFSKSVNNSFSNLKSDIETCDINKKQFFVSKKLDYSSHSADSFIKEFCEILELFEVKQTNFFISTLLTAVLTHHLGWVSTVIPPSQEDKNTISKMQNPCNPLWGQLSDLYGAVGHPTKMSRTIICGNKNEVMEKILNILTYFIRCSAVEKHCLSNFNVCDLNLSSLEEEIPKNIPFEHKQKTNEYKAKFITNTNETDITKNQNLEELIEMETLKVPNIVESSSKNNNNNKKRSDIKSHSNSSIEKTSNYLLQPVGLKSMKKSTSYVGNLCRQSGSNFNELQNFDTNPVNKNEVVFVLGENEELKNLKKSTECVNKIGNLAEISLKEIPESNIISIKKSITLVEDQNDNFSLDKQKCTNTIKKNSSRILFSESVDLQSQLNENTRKFPKFENCETTPIGSSFFVEDSLQSETKFQIGSFENTSNFDPKYSQNGKNDIYPVKLEMGLQNFDQIDGDFNKKRSNFFSEEFQTTKSINKLKKISKEMSSHSGKIGRFLVTKSDEMDFVYPKNEHKIFSLEVPSNQEILKMEKSETSKVEDKNQNTVLDFVECCSKFKKSDFKSQNFDYDTNLETKNISKNENPNFQTTFGTSRSQYENLESNYQNVPQATCSNNDVLNIPSSSKMNRPTELKLPNKIFTTFSDSSPDSPSPICQTCADISPCSDCEKMRQRSSSLHLSDINNKIVLSQASKILLESDNFEEKVTEIKRREGFDRSQSVPPSDKKRKCSKISCKKKYAGIKFDMRQYPQIVTQYMKSKDLELSQLPFGEKSLKLNRSFSTTLYDNCLKDFPTCDCEHDTEVLTTPSNASELEFTSDLECDNKYDFLGSHSSKSNKNDEKENLSDVEKPSTSGEKSKINSTIVIEHPLQENTVDNAMFVQEIDDYEKEERRQNMVYTEFPVPRIDVENFPKTDSSVGYTHTLLRGINQNYVSDMVLQGTIAPLDSWEHILKRDLRLTARQPLLDQPIQEAVAIVANTDTWEVQLISSHSYVVERGCAGVRICLSQLVANMLESLLHMWKLRTPTEYCLMHIESKLREFCLHSKTMAQILMNTDFCNMDMLTSALQLEVNDIPLLMAVASTHTPQVTQKYGLSFQ